MELEYLVTERDAGRTVLSILRRELSLSAGLVRRLKAVQGICADGVPVYTNEILRPGMRLSVQITAAEPVCGNIPGDGPVAVLYEEAGFLAAAKPAGQLVHPTHARYSGTLANDVAGHLLRAGGDGRCHVVNRLDRDTSGVVLFAKNSYMKDRLSKALAVGEKIYLAVACGRMPAQAGAIDLPIRRLRAEDMMRGVAADGQPAVTHYEVLWEGLRGKIQLSVLRLRLETGRTHQIRVHCAALGCPLLGDVLYGTPETAGAAGLLGVSAQQLHAGRLAFIHPLHGGAVDISAPVPAGILRELLTQCGLL